MENSEMFDIAVNYVSSIIDEICNKYEIDRNKIKSTKYTDAKGLCCHFGYALLIPNSGGREKTKTIGSPVIVMNESGDILCGRYEIMADFSRADADKKSVRTSLIDDQTIRNAIEERLCLLTGN